MNNLPKVSVILVNYNGKKHLPTCLDSLAQLDYPQEKLEIVIVDNGSADGSVDFLKKNYPRVKLVINKDNKGFAYAVNQGAKKASSEYIALLNNDMKVEPTWLVELVKPILKDNQLVCTGSKVLDWEGKRIDFALGMMNFEGRGFQVDFEKVLKKGKYDKPKDMLFVNGGALLVEREVFLKLGGFDEDYFAFYEDVDFGWRLWIAGYRVRFIPTSVAYHRHHGTSSSFGQEKLQLLYERNALFSIYKNYSQPVLDKVLAAALLLLNKRAYLSLDVDKEKYRLNNKDNDKVTKAEVAKKGISYVLAIDDFIVSLPKLREKRKKIQDLRKISDEALFRLFGEMFFSIFPGKEYQDAQIDVQHSLGVYDVFLKPKRNKVMILTHEVVADKMAGPGIRCWEIAKVLAAENEVVLSVPNENPKEHALFEVRTYKNARDIKEIAKDADVIMTQGISLAANSYLTKLNTPIVVDSYDPFVLSLLEQHKELDLENRLKESSLSLQALRFQMEEGDYFICASEKQRDFWIGILTTLGRVNPLTCDDDPTLRRLIDVVPFGIPEGEPKKTNKVMKGVVDGIGEKDKVVLWGGGIYNWFDPLSLIRAMALIKQKRSDIKLLFMGVKHPNPNVPEMEVATRTVELSKELGLINNTVFFNYGWVPYEERANYLLEADIGVSTHFNHVETRFSYRTRMLDCLWADLPIICTQGDAISQLVDEHELGLTVPEQNIDKLADAISKLCDDENFYMQSKANIMSTKEDFVWSRAVEPLIDFCKLPYKAPDNIERFKNDSTADGQAIVANNDSGSIGKFRRTFRDHGLTETVKRSLKYIRARV